jgi:hypothetical protein
MKDINIELPPGFGAALTAMEKQFISMRSSGSSIKDIARTLKKSNQTVCDWNKKFAKEILTLRYSEFCNLQKKVIDLKSSRLDFIKKEIERVKNILQKQKISKDESLYEYNKILELYFKLSDKMSNFESEMLMVGIRYKDNISPETGTKEDENNENSVSPVSEENQKNENKKDTKIAVNSKFSAYTKLSKTNAEGNDRNVGNVGNVSEK